MEFIASQLTSNADVSQLREAFIALDTDGDGKLSITELQHMFKQGGFDGI